MLHRKEGWAFTISGFSYLVSESSTSMILTFDDLSPFFLLLSFVEEEGEEEEEEELFQIQNYSK